jgi:hypothetical protein
MALTCAGASPTGHETLRDAGIFLGEDAQVASATTIIYYRQWGLDLK